MTLGLTINPYNMTPKDVIAQAEKWREEYTKDYWTMIENLKIADAVINRDGIIYEWSQNWWLSKYSSYTKDLLQSVEDLEDCKDMEYEANSPELRRGFIAGYNQGLFDSRSALSDIIANIKQDETN